MEQYPPRAAAYEFLAGAGTDVAHPSEQSFLGHLTGVETIIR
jgi:hypothetical protein